MPGIKIVV